MHGTWYDRIGPVYTTIYPVRGGSIDYTYGNLGLWSFTLEVGCCWYSVPTADILPTTEEIAPTMVLLAEWVSDCNGNGLPDADDIATGDSDDCNGNYTPDDCEPDFDTNGNCDVDLIDYWRFRDCLLQSGPGGPAPPEACISTFDYDTDGNIDLADFGRFINVFTGIR